MLDTKETWQCIICSPDKSVKWNTLHSQLLICTPLIFFLDKFALKQLYMENRLHVFWKRETFEAKERERPREKSEVWQRITTTLFKNSDMKSPFFLLYAMNVHFLDTNRNPAHILFTMLVEITYALPYSMFLLSLSLCEKVRSQNKHQPDMLWAEYRQATTQHTHSQVNERGREMRWARATAWLVL